MKLHVLILDDFAYNLELEKKVIETFLKGHGRDVRIDLAKSVSEALEFLQKTHYDAIIVDMNLPDGSGGAVAKSAKEIDPKTVTAALTLYREEYENYKDYFDHFIKKPIPPATYTKHFQWLLAL